MLEGVLYRVSGYGDVIESMLSHLNNGDFTARRMTCRNIDDCLSEPGVPT